MKLDHIGIAVSDLKEANRIFNDVLGRKPYKDEVVESEGVLTVFYQTGDTKIELLSSVKENSAIARHIEKRGPGLHHIAFECSDINSEIKRLQSIGYQIIGTDPKMGADNKMIIFLHPSDTGKVLIELCQAL